MEINQTKKNATKAVIIEVIAYVLFLLFMYAALSKLFVYPIYVRDLQRSPELAPFAKILSIVVPVSELIISGLLIIPQSRKWGLYFSLLIMILFTMYVWYVLHYSTELPCSCGGIFRNMTWTTHLKVNEGFTLLAAIGVALSHINFSQRNHQQDHQTDFA